jgi:two-component system, chemotaxis family, CheB/CheR fusion protein
LFTPLDKKHRILQRRGRGATQPAVQLKDMPASNARASLPARRHATDDKIDRALARVMQHFGPAYFVIDRNHEVIRFSGAQTGHYIEPSQGAASLNLFRIVHKALRSAVRAAVSQAIADGNTVINENLTIRIDGKARALTLIVEPIAGQNEAATGGSCVVAFRDTTPLTSGGPVAGPPASSDTNLAELERELRGTKMQLRASSDELETRIEDMKSATEEFQAVNEELQAANEELETSKEEMQSINEELQTINNELSDKQELLTRANADLFNLLDSTQIPAVFLDDQLRIRHFTPTLTQLFPVRDSDRGRPLTDIVNQLAYTELQADVEKVQRDGALVERDLVLKDGAHAFMMIIRPYRTARNAIDGVVVTFVDITERKRGEERQLLLIRELHHRTNNLLAVIQSVVQQSLSGTQSFGDARETLTARLHSLANANALLTQTNRYGATLEDVIDREMAGFKDRASIKGPPILLSPGATQGFALVIHELLTNAAKYGALSNTLGKIDICWSVENNGDEPRLTFRWQERGGPPSVPPQRTGFGTLLLNHAISGGDGRPRIEYAAEGVCYTLEVLLSSITEVMQEE